jgi:hypothetical protein
VIGRHSNQVQLAIDSASANQLVVNVLGGRRSAEDREVFLLACAAAANPLSLPSIGG